MSEHLTPEQIDKWVGGLKSGKYNKIKGKWHEGPGNCCGTGCLEQEVFGVDSDQQANQRLYGHPGTLRKPTGKVNDEISERRGGNLRGVTSEPSWASLVDKLKSLMYGIMGANDKSDMTFEEMAQELQKVYAPELSTLSVNVVDSPGAIVAVDNSTVVVETTPPPVQDEVKSYWDTAIQKVRELV